MTWLSEVHCARLSIGQRGLPGDFANLSSPVCINPSVPLVTAIFEIHITLEIRTLRHSSSQGPLPCRTLKSGMGTLGGLTFDSRETLPSFQETEDPSVLTECPAVLRGGPDWTMCLEVGF